MTPQKTDMPDKIFVTQKEADLMKPKHGEKYGGMFCYIFAPVLEAERTAHKIREAELLVVISDLAEAMDQYADRPKIEVKHKHADIIKQAREGMNEKDE